MRLKFTRKVKSNPFDILMEMDIDGNVTTKLYDMISKAKQATDKHVDKTGLSTVSLEVIFS